MENPTYAWWHTHLKTKTRGQWGKSWKLMSFKQKIYNNYFLTHVFFIGYKDLKGKKFSKLSIEFEILMKKRKYSV